MRNSSLFWVMPDFPTNTYQNKCMYKQSINPKYIKQWIIDHSKDIYPWKFFDITVHKGN